MAMKTKEIRQLAMDICEGKVFGTWNLAENDRSLAGVIFFPLSIMEEKDMPEKEVAHVYEYWDKADTYGINDMPMFLSCHFIFKEDQELLQKLIDIYLSRKKDFMEENIPEENAHNLVKFITEDFG